MENNNQNNPYQGEVAPENNSTQNGSGTANGGNPYVQQGYAPRGNAPQPNPYQGQNNSYQTPNNSYQASNNPYQAPNNPYQASNNPYQQTGPAQGNPPPYQQGPAGPMPGNQGYPGPQGYGVPQGQAYKQPKPKQKIVLGDLFSRLFSKQPYGIFKIDLDTVSLVLILVIYAVFSSLARTGINYYYYSYIWSIGRFGSFMLIGFLSILTCAAVLAAMFGYGVLIQGKGGDKKAKMKLVIDSLAASALVPIALYILASIFSFFWSMGYMILNSAALILHMVMFFDGLEIKLGKKSGQLWHKVALIAVVSVIVSII